MTDPIADMLTRIRNANQNHAANVTMPSSKMKETIATILKDEGYITDYSINKNDVQNILTLTLKYFLAGTPLKQVVRISASSKFLIAFL